MTPIDWARLARALAYYQQRGYQYLEVPWTVRDEANLATKPPEGELLDVSSGVGNHGTLVASGEQSFVQLMLEGRLPPGKHVCLTPCWRVESAYNDLYRFHFMKVELIRVLHAAEVGETFELLMDASNFFHSELPLCKLSPIKAVEIAGNQWDLDLNDIEIGSYGPRQFCEHRWVYGTGLAEPRFSAAAAHVLTP